MGNERLSKRSIMMVSGREGGYEKTKPPFHRRGRVWGGGHSFDHLHGNQVQLM